MEVATRLGSRTTGIISTTAFSLLLWVSQPLFAVETTQNPTLQDLQRQVKQRDAIIEDLLRRVKQLENRVSSSPDVAKSRPVEPASKKVEPGKTAQKAKAGPAQKQVKAAAPGSFEVDEKAAERALERTLTLEGALLLPPWSVEIQPSFSYSRSVESRFTLFENPSDQPNQPSEFLTGRSGEVRENQFNFALRTRFGLPFDSQLEFEIPYRIIEQDQIGPIGETAFLSQSNTATAFGDLNIGIAKTLVREKNWWPDVVARVTWDTTTGKTGEDGIGFVDGFHELRGSLIAIKRLDPLALIGSGYYERVFENNDFKPGDGYGFTLGVSLATSPETALSATLQQSFFLENQRSGVDVIGSDQVASSLVFGASWIVGRGSLLSINPAIGLTDDAADYSASVSWSYRLR